MPARMSVIDGEVVASNARGLPDFHALHFRRDAADQLCVWAFDLLFYDGKTFASSLWSSAGHCSPGSSTAPATISSACPRASMMATSF